MLPDIMSLDVFSASFTGPSSCVVSSANTLYVADNYRVSYLDSTLSTRYSIAGSSISSGQVDGTAGGLAFFSNIYGMAIDNGNNYLYANSYAYGTVRKIDLTPPYPVTTVVSGLPSLYGICLTSNGNLYVGTSTGMIFLIDVVAKAYTFYAGTSQSKL